MKLQPLEASCYYHFYNRGNNKENIFKEEDNYSHFLNLLKKYILPVTDVYSYCLLPYHFHFLLKIKDDKLLPENIKNGKKSIHQPFSNLFNAYTKAFNKKYNRTGSLFQKHPKRIRIESDEYLRNLIVYIKTNPTHHNIADFSKYKFSSYQALISNQPTLLRRNEVLKLFEDVSNLKYMHHLKKINLDLEIIQEIIVDDD